MRGRLFAAALAAACVSGAAVTHAQHPEVKTGPAAKPAPAPPAAHETTPAQKPATTPPPRRSGTTELERAVMRIVDEIRKPEPSAAARPSEVAPASTRRTAAARPAPLPRLKLSWRLSLVWPDETRPAADEQRDERMRLNWR